MMNTVSLNIASHLGNTLKAKNRNAILGLFGFPPNSPKTNIPRFVDKWNSSQKKAWAAFEERVIILFLGREPKK